jgi:2-octaprenyl-6-methoxyphenol hydroxylase
MNTQHFDIIIIGGGLVGMTLAHTLIGQGLQIALIDAKGLPTAQNQDGRAIALSYASQQILSTLNIWKNIEEHATPINAVHISRKGMFAKTHLHAGDLQLSALGAVVPAALLAATIAEPLTTTVADLKIIAPATVESVEIKEKIAQVKLQQNGQANTLSARLVIAADGSQSRVAEQLGIYQQTHVYQQMAIVSTLTTDELNGGNAYERFTEHGVIALLPLRENQFGVVWSTTKEQAEKLLALTTEQYCAELQNQMGRYLGKTLSMNERFSYPLTAVSANERIRPRFVLLGNAAHTVHPVAAQGLNLALRSVAWLAEVLVEAKGDIGDLSVLKIYKQRTEGDLQQTQTAMHGLAELTTQITAKPLWSLGLTALDRIPVLKRAFMRRTTGLAGRQAKLIRGVKLHEL